MPPACLERSPRMPPAQTGGSLEDHWRITGGSLEDHWRITGGSLEDHWDHPGIIQARPWGFPGLSLEASSCHADSILERQWDITGTASKRSGMSLRRRSSSACDGALSWDGGPFYGGFLTTKKQTCNNLTWKCLCHNELEKLPQLGTFFRESITAPKSDKGLPQFQNASESGVRSTSRAPQNETYC
jgi:hypothetical protein